MAAMPKDGEDGLNSIARAARSRIRKSSCVRESDVKRVLRACRAVGIDVGSVEVDPATGKITISTKDGSAVSEKPLDEWMASHAR